jgi:hypothetical protein
LVNLSDAGENGADADAVDYYPGTRRELEAAAVGADYR